MPAKTKVSFWIDAARQDLHFDYTTSSPVNEVSSCPSATCLRAASSKMYSWLAVERASATSATTVVMPSMPVSACASSDIGSGHVQPIGAQSVQVNLAAGPSAFYWMCAGDGLSASPCTNWSVLLQEAGCSVGSTFSCMLEAQVLSNDGRFLALNPSLLAPASSYLSSLSASPAILAAVESPAPPAGHPIAITITCKAPAMCESPLHQQLSVSSDAMLLHVCHPLLPCARSLFSKLHFYRQRWLRW